MSPAQDSQGRAKRARLQFLVIAAIFAAPLAAAALLYFVYPKWTPESHLNHGTLIEPPRPVPALALVDERGEPQPGVLQHRWTLVHLGGAECGEACRAHLYLTRQVRTALHKDHERVRRVYVAPDLAALERARAELAEGHPDLVLVADTGAPGSRATDFFQSPDPQAVFLLDPPGNWLMVYAGGLAPKGLHKDLKRLLKFSQLG